MNRFTLSNTVNQSSPKLTFKIGIYLAVMLFIFFSILTFAGSSYAEEETTFTRVLDQNVLEICISPKGGLGFAIIRDYYGWSPYASLYRTKDYGKTWDKIKFMVRMNDYFYKKINDSMFLVGLTIKTNGEVYVTAYNTQNMFNTFPLVKYGQRRIFGSYNQGNTWWINDEYDGDSDYIYINERFRRSKLTKSISDNLFVSEDNGETWSRTDIYLNSVVLDNNVWTDSRVSVNGKTIIVSDPNVSGKLSISADGGKRWTKVEISKPFNNSPVFGVDIANNGYIFVANKDGKIIVSKDNGQTWEKLGELAEVYDISVSEERGVIIILAATRHGIKRAEYKTASLVTTTTSKEGEKTIVTNTVDENRLEEKLNTEGEKAVLTIPVNTKADVVVGELNGQMIKNMERKQAVVEIKNEVASYTLPARQIKIDAVSEQIGSNVRLKDIKVKIGISKSSGETAKIMENSAKSGEYLIVAPPVDFTITCTYEDKTVEVSKFNNYVERAIAIPDGVDPTKITTGVVLNSNGTVSHIPTKKVVIDGKYYTKISSLTNSAFSLIYYPKAFRDVEKHWAKSFVNEMGSRLIFNGIDKNNFAPDREITRAELVVIVVKALGLVESGAANKSSEDWFYGSLRAAYEYDIINGYGDGTFMPNKAITREEAMEIIARAMRVAGIDIDISESDANAQLDKYKDKDGFRGLAAKKYAAACVKYGIVAGSNGLVKPKDKISRAETATIVMKMLQKANLI